MRFDIFFGYGSALPPIPRVVRTLLDEMGNEAFGTNELARLMGADQVLSARLLKLANSAHFCMPQAVSSLHQAIQLLGLVNVRALVISVGLMGSFVQLPEPWLKRFWRHNLLTAAVARHWAPAAGHSPELAHTLGLLQGIGQLLMRLVDPKQMQALDAQADPFSPERLALEHATLGYTYTDISAELARRWQLPAQFAKVLAAVAEPAAHPGEPLAALVHLAAWQVWATEQGLSPDQQLAAWPNPVALLAGVADAVGVVPLAPWDEICPELDVLLG